MKKTLFTASCVLVALSGLGAAATYQWTGNGDGSSWTDADNWTEAGVPPTTLGAGNSIIINSDASISTAGAGSLNYRNVVADGKISPSERRRALEVFRSGLNGYTYYEL